MFISSFLSNMETVWRISISNTECMSSTTIPGHEVIKINDMNGYALHFHCSDGSNVDT